MAISKVHKTNFDTLQRAWADHAVCLMECTRKSDGKQVAMVCAVGWDGEMYNITPFAEMVNGNPFEDYLPPVSEEKTMR